MKKIIAYLMTVFILGTLMTACSNNNQSTEEKLSIVTTIFPEYDWVREILGTHAKEVDLTMLLDNGVDLHSYQPTADDMISISTCDLFIYVGGESDAWVEDVLKQATNKDMVVVNLLDVLGTTVKEEEVIEGMQKEEHEHSQDNEEDEHKHDDTEEEHNHEDTEEEHNHEEGKEYDEHVWLSLKHAKTISSFISDKLCEVDPSHAEDYERNSEAYGKKLDELDTKYQQVVDVAKHHSLLFGDRFPFRYLVDDYGLTYYAAFVGCSAETEASFETVAYLAKKVDELELQTVLTIEGAQHKIAETIIKNTINKNQKVESLDSMQAITSKDVANGVTYLSIMEKNLKVLQEALN